MRETSNEISKEKRFWRRLGAGGFVVAAAAGLYIDKHEVRQPEDAFATITRFEDGSKTLTHIDKEEIPVGIAGLAGAALALTAAGALIELRREQSAEDNDQHQL